MNPPQISIIIPVYNSEKYLGECLDSVKKQTFTDFEVLLINDGSTDNSGDICDQYAKNDLRFKVFHKKNGGVSSARNLGIEKASGEWITFVDSDDLIEENALKNFILTKSDQIDFFLFGVKKLIDEKEVSFFYFEKDQVFSVLEFINKYPLYQYYAGPWSKFFKSSIIKINNITFDKSLNWGEDALFNVHYLNYSNTVRTMPQNGYLYRELKTGLSFSKVDDTSKLMLIQKLKSAFQAVKGVENNNVDLSKHFQVLVDSFIWGIYKTDFPKNTYQKLKTLDKILHKEMLSLYIQRKGKGKVLYYLLKTNNLAMSNILLKYFG